MLSPFAEALWGATAVDRTATASTKCDGTWKGREHMALNLKQDHSHVVTATRGKRRIDQRIEGPYAVDI